MDANARSRTRRRSTRIASVSLDGGRGVSALAASSSLTMRHPERSACIPENPSDSGKRAAGILHRGTACRVAVCRAPLLTGGTATWPLRALAHAAPNDRAQVACTLPEEAFGQGNREEAADRDVGLDVPRAFTREAFDTSEQALGLMTLLE